MQNNPTKQKKSHRIFVITKCGDFYHYFMLVKILCKIRAIYLIRVFVADFFSVFEGSQAVDKVVYQRTAD